MTEATLAILVDDDGPVADAIADHGGSPEEALEDMARVWSWTTNARDVADAAKNGGEP
jgi:hypothetical protein